MDQADPTPFDQAEINFAKRYIKKRGTLRTTIEEVNLAHEQIRRGPFYWFSKVESADDLPTLHVFVPTILGYATPCNRVYPRAPEPYVADEPNALISPNAPVHVCDRCSQTYRTNPS